jgi:hypothetical protein
MVKGCELREARSALGPTQPLGIRGSFLGIKQPGCVANYSPPSSAEVRNARSYTSTPPFVIVASGLIKRRDNFAFTGVRVRSALYSKWSDVLGQFSPQNPQLTP